MKRKAILIESSNVRGQTDLPGARKDIENWSKFLQSDLGGDWDPNEIIELHKPTVFSVQAELNVDSDYYCFVAFSGHGREGHVLLNEQEHDVPIDKIKPSTDQGTFIVDACRGTSGGTADAMLMLENEIRQERATHAAEGLSRGGRDRMEFMIVLASANTTFKTAFEEGLSNSGRGIVTMYACSKGQAAGEDPNAGGHYTSLLIFSAAMWGQQSSSITVYTTKNAHDDAARKLPPQQKPEYSPLGLNFPFAVNP